jgi:hypothetical protein
MCVDVGKFPTFPQGEFRPAPMWAQLIETTALQAR